MLRATLAFIAALLAWVVSATILNRLLRLGMPTYAAAEPAMTFTLLMQCARLVTGALASLAAGYTVSRIAPAAARLPLVLGVVLLLGFLPVHYGIWNRFPIWYHLVFLGTLVPLVLLGAQAHRMSMRTRINFRAGG